jgi:hypothetical protein
VDDDDDDDDPAMARRRGEWERIVFVGLCLYLFLNFTVRALLAVVEA